MAFAWILSWNSMLFARAIFDWDLGACREGVWTTRSAKVFPREGGNQDVRAPNVVGLRHRESISGLGGLTEVWGGTYRRRGGEKERGKGWIMRGCWRYFFWLRGETWWFNGTKYRGVYGSLTDMWVKGTDLRKHCDLWNLQACFTSIQHQFIQSNFSSPSVHWHMWSYQLNGS